jgi:ABC-type multidrug transport system fused ATPase/permease subunit
MCFYRSWKLGTVACSIIPLIAVINKVRGSRHSRPSEALQATVVGISTHSPLTPVFCLLGFSAQYYSDWMHKNAEQVQAALAEANSQATEVVGAIRTVASFGNERGEWARYSRKIMDYYRLNVRQTAISGVYYMLCCTFLMNTVVQAALLIFGAYYVLYDGMPPELLLAFMLYQGQLQEYFQNLLNSFTNLIKSSGAGTKVWSVLGLHAHGVLRDEC